MRVAATIVALEHDHVRIQMKDGREWPIAIGDVPWNLHREGQAVFIEHDAEGYATAITARIPDPLPSEVQQRIDDLRHWVEAL